MRKYLFGIGMILSCSLWLGAQETIIRGNFKQTVNLVTPQSNTWQIQLKGMVPEGTNVKAGDPVVRFDTSNLVTEIENLETSLQLKWDEKNQKLTNYKHQTFELETKVKQAEIRYKIAQLEANIPRGIDSDYDYEKKQFEMKKALQKFADSKTEQRLKTTSLQAELKTIEIEIEEARNKLQKYKKILGSLTLYAKTDGTLMYAQHPWQRRKIQVGDNVFTSMTVATIPDKSSLYVDAWVDAMDMKILKSGLAVDFQLDAYPQKKFKGIIQDIMNSAESRKQWGRAHYFNVMINMKTRDESMMKPGMSAKCCVHIDYQENAILVPLEMVAYHQHTFWIKPRGKEVQKIRANGINYMFIRLADESPHHPGTVLEPINISELKDHVKK